MLEIFKAGVASVYFGEGVLFEHINKKLWISGPIKKEVKEAGKLDLENRVIKKIEEIISRVQFILKMYPRNDSFKIIFVKDKKALDEEFYKMHGYHVDNKALYSIKHNIVFSSVRNLKVHILAHEIAHAFIKMYFLKHVPLPIQELLVQYVVKNLNNGWLK